MTISAPDYQLDSSPSRYEQQQLEAQQRLQQQRQASERAQLIRSSFPARLKDALQGCALHVPSHASEELRRDAALHTADVAEVIEKAKFNVGQLQQALDQAGEVSDESDLFVSVENFHMNRLDEARRSVQLWDRSLSLARRLVEELAAFPEPAKKELERVVAEVRSQLIEIGCGPDAMQGALRQNTAAAEKQFTYLVSFQNTRTRAARIAADEATRELKAAQSTVSKTKTGLTAARDFLASEMQRAVGEQV